MKKTDHVPVLVDEILENLATNQSGAYLDLTVGLGGHLKAIGKAVSPKARLYGIDRDQQAITIAGERLLAAKQEVVLKTASYHEIKSLINNFEDKEFDGILLDLGVSSMQIDRPERGFSFRFDGPLDMRFNADENISTAADLINSLTEAELSKIFFEYGEERNARRIAKLIVRERQKEMILTTSQLSAIIAAESPARFLNKSLARIYQALRIAVNKELDILSSVLPDCIDLLKKSGRIAILTYHSLEDRLVKQSFVALAKGCICPPKFPVCACGLSPTIKIKTRRPIMPTGAEQDDNPRSRSAKLRVAEKI